MQRLVKLIKHTDPIWEIKMARQKMVQIIGLYGLIKTKNTGSGSDKTMEQGFWPSFFGLDAPILIIIFYKRWD